MPSNMFLSSIEKESFRAKHWNFLRDQGKNQVKLEMERPEYGYCEGSVDMSSDFFVIIQYFLFLATCMLAELSHQYTNILSY